MSRYNGLDIVQTLMAVLRKELEDLAANSNGRFVLYVRDAIRISLLFRRSSHVSLLLAHSSPQACPTPRIASPDMG